MRVTGIHIFILAGCFSALLLSFPVAAQVNARYVRLDNMDTATVMALIRTGGTLSNTDPQKALQSYEKALEKSRSIGYTHGMATAYARMGRWYFGNNVNHSILYAQKALLLYVESDRPAGPDEADMHLLLAEAYDEQGHKDSSAYFYYLLGSEIEAGNINNPELMINIYTKLAIFWINLNDGNAGDNKIIQTIQGYVIKAQNASRQMKDTAAAMSSTYFLQGAYYHSTRQFDSARYFYLTYLERRAKAGGINIPRKISTLTNIADTYLQENKPGEAMVYIDKVKELGRDPQNKDYLSFFMSFNGLLEGRALYQQKQYAAAVQVLKSALEKLSTTGGHLRNEVVEAYKISADCYEKLGQYPQALADKNMYIALYDSLSKKDKLDMVARLEIRYRISEKDRTLALQRLALAEAENKVKSRNLLIAGIGLLLLMAASLLTFWRRRNIHKQKLQQRSIEILEQKIKIERLNATLAGEEKERARIARELHDGISGLLTGAKINFELVKKQVKPEGEAGYMYGLKLLEEAGSELRQSANNLMPSVLLQEGLVRAVQTFCSRISGKSGTQIDFQSFGEKQPLQEAFELSLYRIIQELIHNIVKHARASHAVVQLDFQPDGGINITVEDDGIGMPEKQAGNASGMGLQNIRERVQESGGRMDIRTAEGQGTSIYIEFEPQQENES